MRSVVVIGKNFGDEGKGLAVDYFTRNSRRPLVLRHNGGAQSGHTVERKDPTERRFVFHELSSGSFCTAGTLWTDRFYPDLYKLGEETEHFRSSFGFLPEIYGMEETCITLPDDVLINMALESSRGNERHGSCGMGINECDLRTRAGYGLGLGKLIRMTGEELVCAMSRIRREYTVRRIKEIRPDLTETAEEYLQLLAEDNLLKNAAEEILVNMKKVQVLSKAALGERLRASDTLIFESGQGLLLDCENRTYAPHVTASHTGLANPCVFLKQMGYPPPEEAVYVSRTYMTRHGAGFLPGERPKDALGQIQPDRTNGDNRWQGQIRYAPHGSVEDFTAEVRRDMSSHASKGTKASLFLTHLNETDNCVLCEDGPIPVDTFIRLPKIRETFDTFYLSASRYSDDVRMIGG